MSELATKKPDYGNWVSAKLVCIPSAVAFLFLGLLKAVCHLFLIDSKKFGSGQLKPLYPRTVEQAVDRLFSKLPFKDKTQIAKMEDSELELLHPTLGKYIMEEYGLRFKSSELLNDCRFITKNSNLHENHASAVIIKGMWKRLRKTHALRVVKKKG